MPRKSNFTTDSEVPDDHFFDTFGNGVNRKISKQNLFAQIKKQAQTYYYDSEDDLKAAKLEADPDNPIYVRVAPSWRLYRITSLAPVAPYDIALNNGATATLDRLENLQFLDVDDMVNAPYLKTGDIVHTAWLDDFGDNGGNAYEIGVFGPADGVLIIDLAFNGLQARRINIPIFDITYRVFNTKEDMESDPTLFVGQRVRTLGYNDIGDGGGNDYEIVAAGTGTPGPEFFINLTGISGQAKKITKNVRALADSGGISGRISMGVAPVANSLVVIRSDSDNDPDIPATVQIQRFSRTDDGIGVNPKALRVFTRVDDPVSATEWAISGELDNYSNNASTGNSALSGVSRKFGAAAVFAGHLQVQDYNEYALPTDVTSVIGTEINAMVIGPDHPATNSGFGARQILDLIALTNINVPSAADGEVGMGLRIRCDNGARSDGYFRYGIVLEDGIGGNPNPMQTGLRVHTGGSRGIHLTKTKSIADIVCESVAPIGIIMNGTYTESAIRVPSGAAIGWENTNAIKTLWDSGASQFKFQNSGNNRAAFNLSATPSLLIQGLTVVKERKTGWGLPTGTATRTAFNTATVTTEQLAERLKALIDDLHIGSTGHGLIGS